MLKRSLLAILVLGLSYLVTAQDASKKNVLLINSGVSIPFGEFAEKQMLHHAGFAGLGGNLEVDYLRMTERVIGLCAHLGYSNMDFSKQNYLSEYERILVSPGEITVAAGNYQLIKGTVGLFRKLPEFLNTEILFHVQAGYAFHIHPEIEVNHAYWDLINSMQQDTDWQLISMAGVGIMHRFSENIGINLGYNINSSKPSFSDESNSDINRYFNLPIRFHNINMGIVLDL